MASEKDVKEILNPDKLLDALDWVYDKAVGGISGTSGCWQLANDYLGKYGDNPKIAAKKLANAQIIKCTTSGVITSFGGLLTLPIAIPANLTSVWYLQLQMIAAIAVMGGYNPSHDEVKMLCYACLTGTGVSDVLKQAGVKFANKGGKILVGKVPIEVIRTINKKLGMRFVTKFGEKGIVNLGKMVPVLGAVVGGGFDLASTRIIANTAIKAFLADKIL